MYKQTQTRKVAPIALRFAKPVHGPCGEVWPYTSPICPGCSRKA
jgi:hypothetical protein